MYLSLTETIETRVISFIQGYIFPSVDALLFYPLRTVPTKGGGFRPKLGPCGKSGSLQKLMESIKKNGGSLALFRDN